MDGLNRCCRVEQQHIDPAPAQQALGTGGQTSGHPGAVLQDPRRPDKQIHIAAAQGVVDARAEQQHLAIGTDFSSEMRFQGETM